MFPSLSHARPARSWRKQTDMEENDNYDLINQRARVIHPEAAEGRANPLPASKSGQKGLEFCHPR
jgi:hypothetical protein